MPKVYIIILNYKKWQDVVECLESVFRLRYDNYTVIVVDNDSQNGSLEHLQSWALKEPDGNFFPYSNGDLKKPATSLHLRATELLTVKDISVLPQLIFIQNEQNLGFAGGNNVALRFIKNENAYVWLLNPDMVVQHDTLFEMVTAAENASAPTVTGAVTKSYSDTDKVLFYGGGSINFKAATVNMIEAVNELPRLDYISGGSMLTHTKHLNDVGMLPEEYFLYWEETDWCFRARQKGYQLQVCLTAICYDKISTTIGRSFLADFYYTRNGLMFLAKYKKDNVRIALFFAFLRMCKRILTGRFDRAKGVYKGAMAFLKREHENQ